MSKTIEELRAEVKAAETRLREASQHHSTWTKALNAALLEATGLAGHRVSSGRRTIVADRIARWSDTAVEGFVIRKDGTRGVARDRIDLKQPYTDHGLWQE